MIQIRLVQVLLLAALAMACLGRSLYSQQELTIAPSVYQVAPGDDLQYRLQSLLVQAVPGDVIEFGEGRYALLRQIDIATDNITLRGQGSNKTVLSFDGQRSGGQGIEATGDNFVVEGLAVEDTAGNAIKVMGARNVTFRDVRTEWTGESKTSNGAYGLYPVQCSNVLIDACIAIGASDSGIYVGQSRGVVVRGCRAERNVAGIEIENCVDASVHDNFATNNAGGLLVFDLPGLQVKAGRNVRLYQNRVVANNHRNFAAPGNIVGSVPSGTGIMIMATDHVEVFDNDIQDNQTTNVALVSYLISGKKIKDPTYDPISEGISIHDNRMSGSGAKPGGAFGGLIGPVLGLPLPDILFDGVVAKDKLVDGELPDDLQMSIVDNGEATFANFNLSDLSPTNVARGRYKVSRDLSRYAKSRPPIPETRLMAHDPPAKAVDRAVLAYRTAPKELSKWGLFDSDGPKHQPAKGVVPYTLNTTLFSDYTTKYRFIRIPDDTSIRYTNQGTLDFPDGTVIAKTFAYRNDRSDATQGEQLLETRIEFLQDGDWFGYAYRWNEEQTEAFLTLGGGVVDVSWIHDDGDERTNRYEIPNPNQCLNCHSQGKTYVPIGPTAMNMNCDFTFTSGRANQLDYLAEMGLLTGLPPVSDRQRMPVSNDPQTGSLDERSRAWLHVNCAHCHSPLGTARTSGLDLQYSQADPSKFGIWKAPVAAGHGAGGREYDIVPGKPDESILLFRVESEDPSIRMPNVARNLVPIESAKMIREWIAGMPKDN